MKRAFAVSLILSLLISALAGTLIINFATADPVYVLPPPIISVTSPVDNKTYNINTITLIFAIPTMDDWGSMEISQVQYSLDGKTQPVEGYISPDPFSVTLPKLTEGTHILHVSASVSFTPINNHIEAPWNTLYSSPIRFTVDTIVPRVSILSTQGTAYTAAAVSFNFTVNEAASWLGYSLDGKNVVAVTSEVTKWSDGTYRLVLSDLPAGAHSLTVYADDLAGNRGASEPFSFTVAAEEQPETEQTESEQPFSTAFIAVALASVVAICVLTGFLLYFKKFRPKNIVRQNEE